MTDKALNFLSSEVAINEVFVDLAMHPDKWYEFALFAKVYAFLTKGKAWPAVANSNKEERADHGIWYVAKGARKGKFVPASDFKKLAIDLIPKVKYRVDEIAQIYEWTMWVNTVSGKGPDGEEGLWVETEMENFRCTQCGHCCRSRRYSGNRDRIGGDTERAEQVSGRVGIMKEEIHEKKLIRNSTVEFLIFTSKAGEASIEVRYKDETIWLTQKMMATLFDVNVRTINEHLQNILSSGELQQESVIRKFRNTASDGKQYLTNFYNLDAIISVGYRVNSKRATQFRQWATRVLREFAIKGYVLDRKRLENGVFLEFDEREILRDSGKAVAEIAKEYAESEFEKFRVVQDRLFESDFDRVVKQIEAGSRREDIEEGERLLDKK